MSRREKTERERWTEKEEEKTKEADRTDIGSGKRRETRDVCVPAGGYSGVAAVRSNKILGRGTSGRSPENMALPSFSPRAVVTRETATPEKISYPQANRFGHSIADRYRYWLLVAATIEVERSHRASGSFFLSAPRLQRLIRKLRLIRSHLLPASLTLQARRRQCRCGI